MTPVTPFGERDTKRPRPFTDPDVERLLTLRNRLAEHAAMMERLQAAADADAEDGRALLDSPPRRAR